MNELWKARLKLTAAALLSILCEMAYITLPYLQRIVIDDFIANLYSLAINWTIYLIVFA